jgi:hypothetical protein
VYTVLRLENNTPNLQIYIVQQQKDVHHASLFTANSISALYTIGSQDFLEICGICNKQDVAGS